MCTWNIVWWWNVCPSAMHVEAGICEIQSQCKHICMSIWNYECMYVHTYTIFICIEAQGFVIDFSSGSMFCILHTRLFRPRHSHKSCFYTDKIQHIIYTHKCIYMFMYTITSEKLCTKSTLTSLQFLLQMSPVSTFWQFVNYE